MDASSRVRIPEYTSDWVNGKEVTFYSIDVCIEDTAWQVRRRYNEFEKLHEELKKNHALSAALPAKSFFALKKPEEINKRRLELESYLQAVFTRTDVFSDPAFDAFIELQQHRPSSAIRNIAMHGKISHLMLGYRDVLFGEDRKFYFAVTADPNGLSRFDAFFSNVSMPWEKATLSNQAASMPVGSLEFWFKETKSLEDYVYEKVWIQVFKSQMFCLDFCEELRMVVTGSDEGELFVTQLAEEDPRKYSEYFSGKIHDGRVMRTIIDFERRRVYSVAKDKHLKIFDLKTKEVTHFLSLYSKKLTEMVVDFKRGLGFISDEGGSVAIVNLLSNPPQLSHWLKTGSPSPIRGLALDLEDMHLFCASHDDHTIYAFDISEAVLKDKKPDPKYSVKTASNPRCLVWWQKRKELVIGHKGGILSVFNAKVDAASPTYSAKVHLDNINAVKILPNLDILVSASSDKSMKVAVADLVLEVS